MSVNDYQTGIKGVSLVSHKASRRTFRDRLDNMVQTLRHEILTGKFAEGEYLPSEAVLAEQFQLSKNSARAGLEVLVNEGFITKKPRIGNIVSIPASQEPVTLKLGYYASTLREALLAELISNFQEKYPRIRVEMIVLPYGNWKTIKDYLENGIVDVLTINYSDYQCFLDNQFVERLHPMPVDPDIYSFLSDAFTYQRHLYVQPLIFSPTVLCFNRHHFHESGVPEPQKSWTWKTVSEVASRLTDVSNASRSTDGKRFGLYFYYLSENRWMNFLLQSGRKFSKGSDGKYEISGTSLEESLHYCRDLISQTRIFPRHSSETDMDAEQLFLQEKVSMIMTTYFNLNYLTRANFAFDIAPLPFFQVPKSLLLIIGLAVNQRSKQKEAALELLHYLTGLDAQLLIRKKTLSIPSVQAAAEWIGDEEMYRPSRFHLYRDIKDTFALPSELDLSAENVRVLHENLKFFWSRMVDDNDFFEKLAAEMK